MIADMTIVPGLVIDTNIFIDVEQGRLQPDAVGAIEQGSIFMAAITVSELLAGVHLAKSTEIRIRRSAFVEGIISQVPVLEFNKQVARVYAEIYAATLKSRARVQMNVHDLQIAATAIAHGFSVLTGNVADFKKIPGLNLQAI